MYICQTGFELVSYNTTTEKTECDCKIQEEEIITSLENIKFYSRRNYRSICRCIKKLKF